MTIQTADRIFWSIISFLLIETFTSIGLIIWYFNN